MKLQDVSKWLNENQGLLTVILFLASIAIGWFTGIYRSLIRKPKFKIRVISKMTFGSVYLTGERYTPPGLGTYDLHVTAFVVYLEITNIGSAPSNLGKIQIGYYKNNGKSKWLQKREWIKETNILDDFIIPTADGQAILIPHLRQPNYQFDQKYDGFLEIGKSIIGAAYFEQSPSWGNFYPRLDNETVELKIKVKDAFDNTYCTKTKVPVKTLEEALRYNSRFGLTMHLLDKDEIVDKHIDQETEDKGGEK